MAKKSVSKSTKSKIKGTVPVTGRRAAASAAADVSRSTEGKNEAPKKVSQNLIDTIEKRKQAKAGLGQAQKGNMFGRPPVRRGRRPKRPVEYTPVNSEESSEDPFEAETDYGAMEYDTGIRLKEKGHDDAFSLDRSEDFDEELNFDR